MADSLTGTTINFTYDDDGCLTSLSRPHGLTTNYTYNAANWLTRIQDGPIADQQYTHNAVGEVAQVNQTLPLDTASLLSPRTDSFTYDDASRVNSHGYVYDARGRQTSSPGHAFTWNGAGKLAGIDTATLEYNGLGTLIRRTEGGTTTHYYYNHAISSAPIVAERNETTGQFLRYYVWTPDGTLLYMIDAQAGNKVYFYHYDYSGSTIFLTDNSGAVTDSYAYTPYGILLKHNGLNPQPFTFIGKYGVRQEGTTGLYQMHARYYDAVTARFLSMDPKWPWLDHWAGLNPYLYAFMNPLNYIDIEGKSASLAIKIYIKIVMKSASTHTRKLLAKSLAEKKADGIAINLTWKEMEEEMNKDYFEKAEDKALLPVFEKTELVFGSITRRYERDLTPEDRAFDVVLPVFSLSEWAQMESEVKFLNMISAPASVWGTEWKIKKLETDLKGLQLQWEETYKENPYDPDNHIRYARIQQHRAALEGLRKVMELKTVRGMVEAFICEMQKNGFTSPDEYIKWAELANISQDSDIVINHLRRAWYGKLD